MNLKSINLTHTLKNKKNLVILTCVILLLISAAAIILLNVPSKQKIITGTLYIDSITAPEGINVEIVFSDGNAIDPDGTDENGIYQIDISEFSDEKGTCFVEYNERLYVARNQTGDFFTITLGDSTELLTLDLFITTTNNSSQQNDASDNDSSDDSTETNDNTTSGDTEDNSSSDEQNNNTTTNVTNDDTDYSNPGGSGGSGGGGYNPPSNDDDDQTTEEATITATAGIGGTISPSGSITVIHGENLNFSFTPNDGYYISDVVIDDTSQGSLSYYQFTNIDDNHEIHVDFELITYTLTITQNGTGAGTIEVDHSEPYFPGTIIQIWANASSESFFSKWTGDLNSTNSIEILLMNSDKSVNAEFIAYGQPPIISIENPINNTNNVDINKPNVTVNIQDINLDTFNWTIEGKYINNIGANDDVGGIKTASLMTPLPFDMEIIWYVNATDSYSWINKTYTFRTHQLQIPTIKQIINTNTSVTTVGPLAADVTGDGSIEIIRTGLNGTAVYDGETGKLVWQNIAPMFSKHQPFEIIDLNLDGIPEILYGAEDGCIAAIHGNNGSLYWHNPAAEIYDKYIVAGDINADGFPEVFVARSGRPTPLGGMLTALTYDGEIYAQVPTGYPCYGGLGLGDANSDGVFELYQGDYYAHGIRSWNPYDLTLNWKQNFDRQLSCESHIPILADVDHDGQLDVIAMDQYRGDYSGVAVLNSTTGESIRWTAEITNMSGHSQPTVYDIDNDGALEILTGGGGGGHGHLERPTVWDLYNWTFESGGVLDEFGRLPYACLEPPGVADITGDGNVEIIQCNPTNVTVYNNKYEYLFTFPIIHTVTFCVAQDVDDDGLIELIFNSDHNIIIYDTITPVKEPKARSGVTFYSQDRSRSPDYSPYGRLAPILRDEYPIDEVKNQAIQPTLSIYVHQYQSDLMNIQFMSNVSGTWTQVGESFNNVGNGLYSVDSVGMNAFDTTYWWSVNVSNLDNGLWTNETYSFTTFNGSNAAWYHPDWEYRKEIFISHLYVEDDLVNFPVLINISVDEDFRDHAQNGGDDFVFTDVYGNRLSHEIEWYDNENGSLVAWVNVTSLYSTVDTSLYLYYGNSGCENQENIAGTWNHNFVLVQHMDEDGDVFDSTSYTHNGTNMGSSFNENGKIDGCHQFMSTNDWINFGNSEDLNPGLNSWTISFWTKIAHINNHNILFDYEYGTGKGFLLKLYDGWLDSNYFMIYNNESTSTYRYWNTKWSDGKWHYVNVVINRDSDRLDLYLDGVLDNGVGSGNLEGFDNITNVVDLRLYGSTDGSQDEFRISGIVRSDEWIQTSFYNQDNPESFYTIWTEDTKPNLDTELPEIRNIQIEPVEKITGKNVNISCEDIDNDVVEDVIVNISGPNNFVQNFSIIKNKLGNKYYLNETYTSVGTYTFQIIAEDNAGSQWIIYDNNINRSKLYNYTIIDPIKPVVSNINAINQPKFDGNYINISCKVTDNLAVNIVKVHITDPNNNSNNVTMEKELSQSTVSNSYFYNVTYDFFGNYSYYIWANDTSENSNISSSYTFQLFNTAPIIFNETPDHNLQEVMINPIIKANLTDLGGDAITWRIMTNASTIWTELNNGIITDGNGKINATTNAMSLYNTTYYWSVNCTDGTYWTNETYSFTTIPPDTEPPQITNVTANPTLQNYGKNINITTTVIDNFMVDTVWINITNQTGNTIINSTMNQGFDNLYYYEYNSTEIGIFNYYIFANDSSDYQTISLVYQFNISIDGPPLIIDHTQTIINTYQNLTFNVTLLDADTITIAQVEYWFDEGNHSIESLNKVTGNNYTCEIEVPIDTSIVKYNISTSDYYGFKNSTGIKQITINDILQPSIIDNTPVTATTGDTLLVNATAMDNIGISTVLLSYWYANETIMEVEMIKIGNTDYYQKEINIPINYTDKLQYNLTATDGAMNKNITKTKNVTVKDNDAPIIENITSNTTENFINISCVVADNIGLNTVKVNITNPDFSFDNISMINLGYNKYFYNSSKINGTYLYHIWALDTSNNPRRSVVYTFTIAG